MALTVLLTVQCSLHMVKTFNSFLFFQRIVWQPKDSDRELCLVKGKSEVSRKSFHIELLKEMKYIE